MVGRIGFIGSVLLTGLAVAAAATVSCSLVNQYDEVPATGTGGTGAGGSAGGCNSAAGCDDGSPCTDDTCTDGACRHDFMAAGTPCTSASGSGMCNADGQCEVKCPSDNPGVCDDGNGCTIDDCDPGTGLCTHVPLDNVEAPGAQQIAGDCQLVMCEAGSEQSTADDSDVPDDGNPCTVGQCNAGSPSHDPAPNGTDCDDGQFCNGATDTCQSSVCTGAGDPCPGPDGDADCTESCNEASDDCTANDPEGSACPGGMCDSGGSCTCGVEPVPPGGICPGVCNGGCVGGTCKIDCLGTSACKGQNITCPQGWACELTCDSGGGGDKEACKYLELTCSDLYACSVVCVGYQACASVDVVCSTGTCSLTCDNANSVCNNAALHCGSNACSAQCTGSSLPTVMCGIACSCVSC